ncbi:MAG: tyrosine-type recombinase/integrase [Leptospira sp.]|nr:tyrosine-type recombinase/integrase [Leptospira sp.]
MKEKLEKSGEQSKELNCFYFTASDITLILSVVKSNYIHHIWFRLLYAFGLTVGELVNLRVGDIDFTNFKIKIASSKKLRPRVLALPNSIIRDLRVEAHNRDADELLFRGRSQTGRIHPRTVQKLFEKVEHQTGMEISVSKIRRSVALHLLQKGWEEKSVTQHLGHSTNRATRKLLGKTRQFYLGSDLPLDEITKNAA